MDGLFSHPVSPEPPAAESGSSDVRVSLEIPGDAMQAAEGFLDYVHLWWPVSLYSVTGPGAQVWWDEDGIVEEAEDGSRHAWGSTRSADPPLEQSVLLELPGAEGDLWTLSISPEGRCARVEFCAPLPRSLPQAPGKPVPEDLWEQVLGFYARFMGVGRH